MEVGVSGQFPVPVSVTLPAPMVQLPTRERVPSQYHSMEVGHVTQQERETSRYYHAIVVSSVNCVWNNTAKTYFNS